MRRREAIAGLGALGVLGAGGAVAFGQLGNSEGDRIDPLELPRIDAPGSPPGTETVPETGRVTYLSLFATWCTICQRKMDPLGEAAAAVDDDVQFVSVTNEPVGKTVDAGEVAAWWADHDGSWPVAYDETLELSRRVGARGVPYSVVFDADNRVTWSDGGYQETDDILGHIPGRE
jgi:thiol-disulfide isomerase/thioredoxin